MKQFTLSVWNGGCKASRECSAQNRAGNRQKGSI